MNVLIIRGSDLALDAFTVVGDDYTDERIAELRSSVEKKGGDLLVYGASSLEDFEHYIKDCVNL